MYSINTRQIFSNLSSFSKIRVLKLRLDTRSIALLSDMSHVSQRSGIRNDDKTSKGMSRVHRYFIPHWAWAGQFWKVKVSNIKNLTALWCPYTHTLTINIYIFYCSYLILNTAQRWGTARPLTPSDILTDCIYSDNYSLCIICTNNHLIISHPRVKSVLFRLHPPVISSFIQTHVTFETLIRT